MNEEKVYCKTCKYCVPSESVYYCTKEVIYVDTFLERYEESLLCKCKNGHNDCEDFE